MLSTRVTLLLSVLLIGLLPRVASAQGPQPEFPPYPEVTKSFEARRGFFTLHVDMKKHRMLAEIPGSQLQRPFLFTVSIAGGYYAGWQWDDRMVYWERLDRKLLLVEPEIRYRAQGPLADVVKRTYRDRVITSLPILTEGPGGAVVVDFSDLLAGRSSIFAGMLARGVDVSLTKIAKAKTFPENVEIELDLVRPGGENLAIHYSLYQLKGSSYRPRVADDRIGYFLTAHKDFSKDPRDESRFVRYVNRWPVEKADPSLDVSPPRNQIIFYVEKTVPIRYRRYVHEGILEWNKAFAKIGIHDAIATRQQTETEFAELDPEDARYNFFRWITSESAFAMGPSRVHPETGQILDADIIFDDSMIRSWFDDYTLLLTEGPVKEFHPALQRYLEEHPERHPLRRWRGRKQVVNVLSAADARAPNVDPSPVAPGVVPPEDYGTGFPIDATKTSGLGSANLCDFGHGIRHQVNFGLMAIALDAISPQPGAAGVEKKDGWPEEFIGQVVKEVVMHEVGHTLGLRHNFKASSWLSLDEINHPERRVEAITGSVMDYNPINVSPKGKPQGDWNTKTLGPYDYWAIEYGYSLKDDPKELQKIASRVAEAGLAYATDEDTWGSDPLVNRFDMGSDPLEFSRRQIQLVGQLLGDLVVRLVKPGDSYQRARHAFEMFLYTHSRGARVAVRHVGGNFIHRDHKGDPNERPPVVPVPAAKQREALDFVCESVFGDKAFRFSPELVNYLAAGRWMHWGSSDTNQDSEYPLQDRILQIQLWTLFDLLNPRTLALIVDGENRVVQEADALTIPELIGKLSDAIWTEVKTAPSPGASYTNRAPYIGANRRNLQHEYIGQLVDIALEDQYGSSPQSARTQAWHQLEKLRAQIAGAVAAAGSGQPKLDDYSRAHLQETFQRITKALDASFSRTAANGGGGGGAIIIIGSEPEAPSPDGGDRQAR